MENIDLSYQLQINTTFDSKLCNAIVTDQYTVKIETIPEYLARVTYPERILGAPVTILSVKDGYPNIMEYDMDTYYIHTSTFKHDYYTFIDGLEDINFVKLPTGDVSTAMTVIGNGRSLDPIRLVNDASLPGTFKYYGTNIDASKGYWPFPTSDSSVITTDSIIGTGLSIDPIKLVNDVSLADPLNYYGTDIDASKGYHPFPDQYTCLSITGTGKEDDCIRLVNDELAPRPNYYYGTDASGIKGYWPFPVIEEIPVRWVATGYRYCETESGNNTGWEWVEEKRQTEINGTWTDDPSVAPRMVLLENLTDCPLSVTYYRWVYTNASTCEVISGVNTGIKLLEKKQQYSIDNSTWIDSSAGYIYERTTNYTDCPVPERRAGVSVDLTQYNQSYETNIPYAENISIAVWTPTRPDWNYMFISIPTDKTLFSIRDEISDITEQFSLTGQTDSKVGYRDNKVYIKAYPYVTDESVRIFVTIT